MSKAKTMLMVSLTAVSALCLAFAVVGCGKEDEGSVCGLGEEGFYYYDGETSRYMLSLQSGVYMISEGGGDAYSGEYTVDRDAGRILFICDDGTFTASAGDASLSLVMDDAGYSFKAFKYFDVTYVDEDGHVLATEQVLNGQSAPCLAIDREGYWFVDWYEDAEKSAQFAFDTSIAGDTTVYGWYIEKNDRATEFDVTLNFGDGVTEKTATQNGAIWSLPSVHDGKIVLGWWISATNSGDGLTYKYTLGDAVTTDMTLYAVYDGDGVIGASVTDDGVTWEHALGANVSVTIYNDRGDSVISASAASSAARFTPPNFSMLTMGVYTVDVSSGGVTETLVYLVKGLDRVAASSVSVVYSGNGKILTFSPVENAVGYEITVSNGVRETTEDLRDRTYYNFSDWAMTECGITFVIRAYADGHMDSVSDEYLHLLVLDRVYVEIDGENVVWNSVDGALEYEVTIEAADGSVETFATHETSFSLKYYDRGTYNISVQPQTDGYYSERVTYFGYGKQTVAAPRISDITSYSVTWGAVDGASSYMVKIGQDTYDVGSNTTMLFTDYNIQTGLGTYEISVKACEANGLDSPYGDGVIAAEDMFVSVLTYERNTVLWDYVVDAQGYEISVNDGDNTYVVTEGNSCEIELSRRGDNKITVTAYDAAGMPLGYAETHVYAYVVTLDGNGAIVESENGEASSGFVYVAQGDELRLGTASHEYADFFGWYTQADQTNGQSDEYSGKGTNVAERCVFTGNRDLYLYAYWSYQYMEVLLDAGDGYLVGEDGSEISCVKVKYGSSSFSLPVPTANSPLTDDFIGWFSNTNGRGIQYTTDTGEAADGLVYSGLTELHAYYLTTKKYTYAGIVEGVDVYEVTATSNAGKVYEMTIPEKYVSGVREYDLILGSSAFATCTNMEVLNIPDTIKYISTTYDGYVSGTGCFAGCANLKEVNVYVTGDEPDSTKEVLYFSEDGVLFHKTDDGAEILYYPAGRSLTSYTIPASVYNEYECEWDGTPIVHTVTRIPSRVFRGKRISEIVIPSGVTYIETQAFYANTYLREVEFTMGGSASLTIEDDAFYNCTSLASITYPARYSEFNVNANAGCTALKNVYIEEGGVYSSDGGVLLDSLGTTLVYFPVGRTGDVAVSELTAKNITRIGEGAFASNVRVSSVTISANISEIGESAFEGCTGLRSVAFEGTDNSVNLTIRTRAFYGITLLSSVSLPSNLTTMEYDAFGGCPTLFEVSYDARVGAKASDIDFAYGSFGTTNYVITLYIGPNVPDIDIVDIFEGGNLEKIIVDENNPNFSSDNYGVLYNSDKSTIKYMPVGFTGDYVVDGNVTTIGALVFANRVNLTSVSIGELVNYIGEGAFWGCLSLVGIYVDEGNATYTSASGVLYLKNEIGDPVELVYCPINCSVTTVNAPSTVVRTSAGAFKDNVKVKTVGFTTTSAFELGENTFYGSSVSTVNLPGNLVGDVISSYSFYNCSSLTSVNIPSNVTGIESYAFCGCSSLRGDLYGSSGITLPEGLVFIGDYAFYGCTRLAVTIPATVETIGDYAFYKCWSNSTYSAKEIKFASAEDGEKKVPLTMGEYAFGYAQNATKLVIPARLVEMGRDAFEYYGYSASSPTLEFEEGCRLTIIPLEAFYWAQTIVSVDIPTSVATISRNAFYNCKKLKNVTFEENSNLETIGEQCFRSGAMTTITIPASVTMLQSYSFFDSSLLEVIFEDGSRLETIGSYAFGSAKIEEISIPAGVTSIGSNAFKSNTALKTVTFLGNGTSSRLTIAGNAFAGCTGIKTIEFPANLVEFGDGTSSATGTFSGCTGLESVTIPASVEVIGAYAFSECTGLKEVAFGDGSALEKIGDYAFYGCTALTEFEFPESSAISIELGVNLFGGSGMKISKITLSSSISDIGNAFRGLKLDTLVVAENNQHYMTDEAGNPILYSKDSKTIAYVFGDVSSSELIIPDTIETIGDSVFYQQTSIESVYIPASVCDIGEYAFYGCTGLKSVSFEEGSGLAYGSLGFACFACCYSLETVILPEGLRELPSLCFYYCTSLKSITLPSSVTYIGQQAFESTGMVSVDLSYVKSFGWYLLANCASLTAVTLCDTLSNLPGYTFYGCSSLEEIELPDSVTQIGSAAFYMCTKLKTVEIPENVTYVGSFAFAYCYSFTEIVLPDYITTIEEATFYGCTGLTSVTLPAYLTTLGNQAFSYTPISSIVFPENLKSVGISCFEHCESLTDIQMNDNLTTIYGSAFRYCTSLESVTIGNRVDITVMMSNSYGYIFADCTSLKYVYTGDLLTTIGYYMFYHCTSLTEVEFGPSVKTLDVYAFCGCTALKELVLPVGLTEICQRAFSSCTALETVIIPSTVTYVDFNAFEKCGESLCVYIQNSETYVKNNWSSTWASSWTGGEIYYYSETEPEKNSSGTAYDGNYWHYDDDGNLTIWELP